MLVSLWHRSLIISHGHVYNGLRFFNDDGVFIGQESLHLISRFHGTRCVLAVVCMLTVKFYLSLDFPFPCVVSWGFILSYFALNFEEFAHKSQATLNDFLAIEMINSSLFYSVFQKMLMKARAPFMNKHGVVIFCLALSCLIEVTNFSISH